MFILYYLINERLDTKGIYNPKTVKVPDALAYEIIRIPHAIMEQLHSTKLIFFFTQPDFSQDKH